MENLMLFRAITLEEIKSRARRVKRVVWGAGTCYWKVGDPVYKHPKTGLPCGPRSEMLMETSDPLDFIGQAESIPNHYGRHGIHAFVAAHHGNLIALQAKGTILDTQKATSFQKWEEYNMMLDVQNIEFTGLEHRFQPYTGEDSCTLCLGRCLIANDASASSWALWEEMPEPSRIAVRLGLVQPEICPECQGSGKKA